MVSYDPAFSYELAHITKDALVRMYGEDPGGPLGGTRSPDVMYYLTVYNEPISQPAEPENLDVQGLLAGMYRYAEGPQLDGPKAQILASGVAVPWALRAQELLANDWNVSADVWSVTSWGELRRQADEVAEHNLLHPEEEPQVPFVTSQLQDAHGPVIAVSDWMRAVPDLIAPVRAARDAVARHRRVRPVRHPAGPAAALPRGRRVDRRPHAGLARRLEPARPRRSSVRRSRSTRSATCRPRRRRSGPTTAPRPEPPRQRRWPGHVRVTVVGGGVIGLTCALELARAGHAVEVRTADPVGDTTSAVAAALWFPYRAAPADAVLRWAATSLDGLHARSPTTRRPASSCARGPSCTARPSRTCGGRPPSPGTGRRRPTSCRAGAAAGTRCTLPVVHMGRYLPWLLDACRAAGVDVVPAAVDRLADVPGDVVVVAAGLALGRAAR